MAFLMRGRRHRTTSSMTHGYGLASSGVTQYRGRASIRKRGRDHALDPRRFPRRLRQPLVLVGPARSAFCSARLKIAWDPVPGSSAAKSSASATKLYRHSVRAPRPPSRTAAAVTETQTPWGSGEVGCCFAGRLLMVGAPSQYHPTPAPPGPRILPRPKRSWPHEGKLRRASPMTALDVSLFASTAW